MARKIRTRKSPEERREQAEALQASIAGQVEDLRSSEAWEAFCRFAASFHAYSLNNILLILSQRPTATQVAGFRQWQARGRQVRKGEKAIKIFGFSSRKVEDEETGEETTRTYYPILSVFAYDQTEPIEGAEPVPEVAQRLTGDDPEGIYDAVADYLHSIGWTMSREAIAGEANGYTLMDGSHRVVVEETLSPAQAAKTALHEAAHVTLHSEDAPGEYVEHRGVKETEAESVAYVAAGVLGLDTAAYSIGYVAGWSDGDAELIKATAENVVKAARTIVDAITTDQTEAA